MARKRITELTLKSIKPPKTGRIEIWDTDVPGFGMRVSETGARSWTLLFRLHGQSKRYTFSAAAFDTVKKARDHARQALALIARGQNPGERLKSAADGLTFGAVAADFIERHAKKKNRSWREGQRIFTVYCARWHARPIGEIRRGDVTDLLDAIHDGKIRHDGRRLGGPVMADRTLASIRKLFNWHAARVDNFEPPIVRGMRANSSQPRDRILSDEEIRAVWHCAGRCGVFGAIVKVLLLTGQRRSEVAGMRRAAIDGAGVWVIDSADYKTKIAHAVPLTAAARAIVDEQPRLNSTDLIFTTGRCNKDAEVVPFRGFSKAKKKLDALVLAELKRQAAERGEDPANLALKPWTLHDIRRSSRTLLSRLKIPTDIAEIVIGHIPPKLRRTYDLHTFLDEKRAALDALAEEIDRIVADPPPAAPGAQGNVIPFAARR